MAVRSGTEKEEKTPTLLGASRLPFSRRAFWGGALFLVVLECLASLVRSHLLPTVPFFRLSDLWIPLAVFKGLVFGPILGILTLRIVRFWRRRQWDDACYLCLRGGFALCGSQALFALGCFLTHSYFPRVTWMVDSWFNFAVWLTLNGALLWALLLLVAGFLLPSDSRKTFQVNEEIRF